MQSCEMPCRSPFIFFARSLVGKHVRDKNCLCVVIPEGLFKPGQGIDTVSIGYPLEARFLQQRFLGQIINAGQVGMRVGNQIEKEELGRHVQRFNLGIRPQLRANRAVHLWGGPISEIDNVDRPRVSLGPVGTRSSDSADTEAGRSITTCRGSSTHGNPVKG